jgi:hypothetical protein
VHLPAEFAALTANSMQKIGSGLNARRISIDSFEISPATTVAAAIISPKSAAQAALCTVKLGLSSHHSATMPG